MTHRGDAPNRETRHGAHEIGVGAPDGFARVLADSFLVDAVRAAGQDENRFVGLLPFEDQRLDDLAELTAGAVCRFLRGARDSACSITV